MADVSDPVLGQGAMGSGDPRGGAGISPLPWDLVPRGLCLHLCMSSPSLPETNSF